MNGDHKGPSPQPPMYEIRILVEVSGDEELEQWSDRVSKVLCNSEHDDPLEACPIPWFVASHELDEGEAAKWRDLLNR